MNTWFPAGGSVWEVVDLLTDGALLKLLVLFYCPSCLFLPLCSLPLPHHKISQCECSMFGQLPPTIIQPSLSVAQLIKSPDTYIGVQPED